MKLPGLKALISRRPSVREAWRASLPGPQSALYDFLLTEWEASFAMLSVTLDGAISLRTRGRLPHARAGVGVAADLFDRTAGELLAALRTLWDHGKHFGHLPEVTALNPDFFRSAASQRTAAWDNLLHRVLLSARSRFFGKLSALDDIVESLATEFREAASQIAEGLTVRPEQHWGQLDALHDDMNTCLRETTIVLKSFLHGLAGEHVEAFRRRLAAQSRLLAGSSFRRGALTPIPDRRTTGFRRK